MNTYFAKISIDYTKINCKNVIVSVKTFGDIEANARENVEMMIGNWQDIESFIILKLSSFPIFLTEYVVIGTVKFKRQPDKKLYFKVKAENRAEAESIFRQKTGAWKEVVSREITEITIY
jgi:hypothetical protein